MATGIWFERSPLGQCCRFASVNQFAFRGRLVFKNLLLRVPLWRSRNGRQDDPIVPLAGPEAGGPPVARPSTPLSPIPPPPPPPLLLATSQTAGLRRVKQWRRQAKHLDGGLVLPTFTLIYAPDLIPSLRELRPCPLQRLPGSAPGAASARHTCPTWPGCGGGRRSSVLAVPAAAISVRCRVPTRDDPRHRHSSCVTLCDAV